MNFEEFQIKSEELNIELNCKVLKLPRGIFIWFGQSGDIGKVFKKRFLVDKNTFSRVTGHLARPWTT